MTACAETPPTVSARWRQIFERQVDLADWGPRRAREGRLVPRVRWTGPVRVRTGRQVQACRGLDLSERGIRIACSSPGELGATLALTLDLFGHMVHAVGEITWVGVQAGRPAIGVSFTVMRDADRRRLANYVASHTYANQTRPQRRSPWDDGKTLSHTQRICLPMLPVVPDYVPVRTGETVAISLAADGDEPAAEPGPSLEHLEH